MDLNELSSKIKMDDTFNSKLEWHNHFHTLIAKATDECVKKRPDIYQEDFDDYLDDMIIIPSTEHFNEKIRLHGEMIELTNLIFSIIKYFNDNNISLSTIMEMNLKNINNGHPRR